MMQTHKGECFCNKCLTADNVGQCCSGSSDALFHARAGERSSEQVSDHLLQATSVVAVSLSGRSDRRKR